MIFKITGTFTISMKRCRRTWCKDPCSDLNFCTKHSWQRRNLFLHELENKYNGKRITQGLSLHRQFLQQNLLKIQSGFHTLQDNLFPVTRNKGRVRRGWEYCIKNHVMSQNPKKSGGSEAALYKLSTLVLWVQRVSLNNPDHISKKIKTIYSQLQQNTYGGSLYQHHCYPTLSSNR